MLWEAQSRFDMLGMPMRGFLSDTGMAVRFQDAAYAGEAHTEPAYRYLTPVGAETFWRLTLLPVTGRLGDPCDVLVTAVDVTAETLAAQARERRTADLAAAEGLIQRTILSTLDADEILQRSLIEATEAYGADWAWIALRELDSWVFRNVHGWPIETIGRAFRESELSLPRLAAIERQVVLASSPGSAGEPARELMRQHDIGAFILVPLFERGEVRGVMGFCWNDPEPLGDEHRDLGEKLSLALTLALENARAYIKERHIARTLQSAFFDLPASVAGVDFAHLYHSATRGGRVGGDFYDIVEPEPGHVGFVIGDVSGHGVDVSALASLVRSSVHVHALEQPDSPDGVLESANDLVLRSRFSEMYASAFVGMLDTRSGRMSYCCAGHPAPVHMPAGGEPRLLNDGQTVLGVERGMAYAPHRMSMGVDDLLVLYTDGLTEARGPGGDRYGTERLLRAVSRVSDEPLERLPESLFLDAFSFADGTLADDVAILALRRT
jgi:serine phosphatase RsbU (regulator of sigma subunit)